MEYGRIMRTEVIVFGLAMLVVGIALFVVPSPIAQKDFVGGITSGAGITVLVTELYTVAERQRHSKILIQLTDLRAQNLHLASENEELIEQNRKAGTKLKRVEEQSEELLDTSRTELKSILEQVFQLGSMLGPCTFHAKVNASRRERAQEKDLDANKTRFPEFFEPDFYSLAESLGVLEAAETFVKYLSTDEYLPHSAPFVRMFRTVSLRLGFKAECFFRMGFGISHDIEALTNGSKASELATVLASFQMIEPEAMVEKYVGDSFLDLQDPLVSGINKMILLLALRAYLSYPGEITSRECKDFFLAGKFPRDKEFRETAQRMIPHTVGLATSKISD